MSMKKNNVPETSIEPNAPAVGSSPFSKPPNHRTIVVNLESTVGKLSKGEPLSFQIGEKAAGTIFKNQQYVSIHGATARPADIRTAVIEEVKMVGCNSTMPIAIGMQITGVEPKEFVAQGDIGTGFSVVIPPEHQSNIDKVLQKNDTHVASQFASEFPGFGPQNIASKGIVEAPNKQSYFVERQHPLMAIVQENADNLQMAHVQPFENNMFMVSSHIVDSLMPPLKVQVARQLPCTNLENLRVDAHPADYPTFAAAFHKISQNEMAKIDASFEGMTGPDVEEKIKQQKAAALRAFSAVPCNIQAKLQFVYHTLEETDVGNVE